MNEPPYGSAEHDQTLLATPLQQAQRRPSAAYADPMLGVELAGTYCVERVLNEGGMGRLYEATHRRIERRFAVKVIHVPLASHDEVRARFEREARVMKRVRSDHVVDVADVVQAPDGRTCIVTELLDGEDLEQYAVRAGGRIAAGEAVRIVRQCLQGLRAAHALGIVHRDLKPSNLFLARDSAGELTLKILDFGVAKMGGDVELTSTGAVVGTPAYMSPEQAREAALADTRSDLYAVGAVLYRLVTGQRPYAGYDANGTLIRLMEEAPPRPSVVARNVTPGLEAVIERAMARDPNERFQSVDELDAALAPFDDDQASTVRSPSTVVTRGDDPVTLGRRARLLRPIAVLVAVLLAVTAGGTVAAALSLLVAGLSNAKRMGMTELVLVCIGAAVASLAAGVGVGRTLSGAWRNAAMVQARSKLFVRSLLTGVSTLGALELGAAIWNTLTPGEARSPFWSAARFIVALLAATTVAVFGNGRRRA